MLKDGPECSKNYSSFPAVITQCFCSVMYVMLKDIPSTESRQGLEGSQTQRTSSVLIDTLGYFPTEDYMHTKTTDKNETFELLE